MKIIITGVTGMVGEGVLLSCLDRDNIDEICILSRKHYDISHPKVKEVIVPNFVEIQNFKKELIGSDACFFCAGISSIGMNEADYTKITYDTTIQVAKVLLEENKNMTFHYVSGRYTDSTEKGKIMWARVKGKTENDLLKLGFKAAYNFRPGFIKPVEGQRNVQMIIKIFALFYPYLFPKSSLTLEQVANAMILLVGKNYSKHILEVTDIQAIASNKY